MTTEVTEMNEKKSYNDVPYHSKPFKQTHPAFLKAVACLSGIETPAIENARILEIGCSMGGNAIPIAQYYPNAEVLGLDIADKQIEVGQKAIEAMGLKNISLRVQDISRYDVPENYFDYIICHGVYSWVPDIVKDSILKVVAKGLNDKGVAIISYNTYPGWKINEVYRDAMLYRGKAVNTPIEKLKYGFGMLDFLKENLPKESPWGVAIEQRFAHIRNASAYYVIHEYLEDVNNPCYFYQFMEKATENGLVFVSEADFPNRFFSVVPMADEAIEALEKEANGDIIKLEQLKDFISNRTFRQTILTKPKENINYSKNISYDSLEKIYIYGEFIKIEEEGRSVWIRHNKQSSMKYIDSPIMQFIARELNESRGSNVLVADLYKKYTEENSNARKEDFFAVVANIIARFDVDISGCHIQFGDGNTKTPQINSKSLALIKWLADNPNTISIANKFHEDTALSSVVLLKELLPYLDGKHDIEALYEKTAQAEKNGSIKFSNDKNQKITDQKELDNAVKAHVTTLIKNLNRHGFLV